MNCITRSSFKIVVASIAACLIINISLTAFAQDRQTTPAPRTLTIIKPPATTNKTTDLQTIVNRAAETARQKFPQLKDDELAISLIELTNNAHSAASYRGTAAIYPASVVKMFYMVAAHAQMQEGKLKDTPELRRAMKDMIVDSSNDATHYMMDVMTGTTAGIELPESEMKGWMNKRQAVNRYFAALGFENINTAQKTWCEAPYGRESVFVKDAPQSRIKGAANNRNALTTDATARLLADIATGKAVNAERSAQMMELMKRDFAGTTTDNDDQAHGFTGLALTDEKFKNVKLRSKAGWTSTTRHDAAYIEMPNGKRFVLVTFTVNHSNKREIIPTAASVVLEAMLGE